jgi:hypothetical protein
MRIEINTETKQVVGYHSFLEERVETVKKEVKDPSWVRPQKEDAEGNPLFEQVKTEIKDPSWVRPQKEDGEGNPLFTEEGEPVLDMEAVVPMIVTTEEGEPVMDMEAVAPLVSIEVQQKIPHTETDVVKWVEDAHIPSDFKAEFASYYLIDNVLTKDNTLDAIRIEKEEGVKKEEAFGKLEILVRMKKIQANNYIAGQHTSPELLEEYDEVRKAVEANNLEFFALEALALGTTAEAELEKAKEKIPMYLGARTGFTIFTRTVRRVGNELINRKEYEKLDKLIEETHKLGAKTTAEELMAIIKGL